MGKASIWSYTPHPSAEVASGLPVLGGFMFENRCCAKSKG